MVLNSYQREEAADKKLFVHSLEAMKIVGAPTTTLDAWIEQR